MPTNESLLRSQFFDYLFDTQEGYLCIATGQPRTGQKDAFQQSFFKWPDQKNEVTNFVDGALRKNLWFGINLYDAPIRAKENCLPANLIWADLDAFKPEDVGIEPQVIIETSTARFQAIWKTNEVLPAALAEEYSRRIYGKFKSNGVDSGWALTKLLRIPFTNNFKYGNIPTVKLLKADDELINAALFEDLVVEEIRAEGSGEHPLPNVNSLPSAEAVIYSYRHSLNGTAFKDLFFNEPKANADWSEIIWRLIRICLEASMSMEETFAVTLEAKCNKYKRDNRPVNHLWLDVVKANNANLAYNVLTGDLDDQLLNFPELVNEDEIALIEPSFINEYIDWASSVTDAAVEYHELSGAILLSIILADKIHLNASWGRIIPNLWGLILGESTLTRKTTAMELAMSFVMEHDPALILATLDSSVEGMFTALSERSEKVSIYYRDEVAGFFDAMSNKSYLAGMPEVLTKLYDVPPVLTRQLRKETITVRRPVFIFFAGGIQERVYSTVNEEFFYSGFLPRFLVVSGEARIDDLRWIGPAVSKNSTNPRDAIRTTLTDILHLYKSQTIDQKVMGQEIKLSKDIEVELTDEAWDKMREIEQKLTLAANNSDLSLIALPTFTRLGSSCLKLSMLIAASRQEPNDFIVLVELKDLIHAAYFIQKWAPHTIDMMTNVGKTTSERKLQLIVRHVRQHPGQTRAELMRRFHLQSIDTKVILQTLDERGLITLKQEGRGYRVWPV